MYLLFAFTAIVEEHCSYREPVNVELRMAVFIFCRFSALFVLDFFLNFESIDVNFSDHVCNSV